jgi:hypothetical protein
LMTCVTSSRVMRQFWKNWVSEQPQEKIMTVYYALGNALITDEELR